MKRTFTPETAKEAQKKAAAARVKNNIERRTLHEYAAAILDDLDADHLEAGIEVPNGYLAVLEQVRKAKQGNLEALQYLAELTGQAPVPQSKVDITTDGKAIEPITGIRIVSE